MAGITSLAQRRHSGDAWMSAILAFLTGVVPAMVFDLLAQTVMTRADELARFSSMDTGICREYGTPEMRAALDRVESWMRDAGMATDRDAFGSLIGTYTAAEEGSQETRPFVIGGHLDSVRDAGRYDGILGVLSGMAVIESLAHEGRRLPFSVQVVAFADEEGVRFRSTLMASRMWAGLSPAGQLAHTDLNGVVLTNAVRAFGGDPDALPASRPEILGFLETHIEQGPVLEAEDLPVGVVTSIAGSERCEITLAGTAGHAGTVPMALRRDALVAASEIVLVVERVAKETPGMVGTVGELEVRPAASNVIPGGARLSCEVRHPSAEACRQALAAIRAEAEAVSARRGVELGWRDIPGYVPTAMDAWLVRLLGEAVAEAGVPVRELPSGAGHDAINISQIAPVSMLFVRCKGGISHNPAESIDVADVEVAIRVMRGFLERYAKS